MKLRLFLFLMNISIVTFGQEVDQSPVSVRNFDPNKLQKLKNDPQYDYNDEVTNYNTYDKDWRWKEWKYHKDKKTGVQYKKTKPKESLKVKMSLPYKIGKNFAYVAAFILLIILVLLLVGINPLSFFRGNKQIKDTSEIGDSDLILAKSNDLDTLISRAIAEEQYAQALRYAYLKTLQVLAKQEYIVLKSQKTNQEYQAELSSIKKEWGKDFDFQVRVFAFIKYGEFEVDKTQFEQIYPNFQAFYQKIK